MKGILYIEMYHKMMGGGGEVMILLSFFSSHTPQRMG